MQSVLIIGMGHFGQHLATKMAELKNEVMIVDEDEDIIEELAPNFTDAHIGDCKNEAVLRSLGVNNFDICFVTIGENFQSSLEITSLLKELGAKYVVSKAKSDVQAKFLLRNGADEIIYPEKQMAEKLAIKHSVKNIFDYIELSPEFAIYEIPILENWAGKSIGDLNVRNKYHLNILTVKNGTNIMPLPGPAYVFCHDDHIIVLGRSADVFKLSGKN